MSWRRSSFAPRRDRWRAAASEHPRALRVASWNIQSCRRGIAGVANGIEALGADLVALQEVERGTRSSGGVDQAGFLAETAGFAHVLFLPALRRDGGEYGQALLSRHPLRPLPPLALPVPGGAEPRLLGLAEIAVQSAAAGPETASPAMAGGRPLTVAFTHLSHRPDRALARWRQARAIVGRLQEEEDCLLLGDFNGLSGTAMHRTLAARFRDVFAEVGQGGRGTHAPLGRFFPALRIDFLFASASLSARWARVVRTRASDHHALVGEIELRGTGEA